MGPSAASPPQKAAATDANDRPNAVYIYDFNLDLSKVKVGNRQADLLAFKQKFGDSARHQLLERLNRAGVACYPFSRDLPPPVGNYWLLDTTLYNIDEQQNALSLYLQRGRGAHTSEAFVEISSLKNGSAQQVSVYETSQQPNREALVKMSPQDAINEDAGRIANLVANHIVKYYQNNGWLPAPVTDTATKQSWR